MANTETIDFEHVYEEPCNCGDALEWEWNADDIKFMATCSFCFREYTLTPRNGDIEKIDS